MAYVKKTWVNKPNTTTPIMADDLNHIEQGIYDATYENGLNVSNEVDEDYRVNLLHSKNLFDKNSPNLLNAYIDGNGKITSDTGNRVVYIPIKPNTTYTISKMVSQRFRVGTYTTIPIANATATNIGTNVYTDATATITSGANDYYLAVWFYNSNFDTENYQTIMNTIQIELGSTATTYEEYITPSIYVDDEEIYSKDNLEQYSTSEIRIGTWINGKPLYRKILDITTNTAITQTIQHGIANLNEAIRSDVKLNISGKSCINPVNPSNNQYCTIWSVSSNEILLLHSDGFNSLSGKIILEYTKTTD